MAKSIQINQPCIFLRAFASERAPACFSPQLIIPPQKKPCVTTDAHPSYRIASTCRSTAPTCQSISSRASCDITCLPTSLHLYFFAPRSVHACWGDVTPCRPSCPSRPTYGTEKFAACSLVTKPTSTNCTRLLASPSPCGEQLICCCSSQTR